MNWHTRYSQQAGWTRDLRSYIFERTDLQNARDVLEVGCGTGAILSELPQLPDLCGLDLNREALIECGLHAPHTRRIQGNVLALPFPDQWSDLVYCHFLLLWVRDPLQALREMKRVARPGGYVIAFAEPDYHERLDEPAELKKLGSWQTEALIRQGADPNLGKRLASLFFEAGINIIETGTIQTSPAQPSIQNWELEWEVIEADLHSWVPDQELQKMKSLDRHALSQGSRVLHVPTYFAWGRV